MSQTQTPDDTSSTLESAYDKVATYIQSVRLNPKENELHPKLLDAMLTFAPCEDGNNYVAQSIIECSSNEELYDLAQEWLDNLLLPMKAQGGRTPVPSSHGSAVVQYWDSPTLSATREPPKGDHGLYEAEVSKLKDWKYYNRELDKSKIKTEATHILPFSLNNLTSNQMWSRKPRVWQIIEMFSQVQLDEFNGQDINRLENVLTLSSDLHSLFGELNIWFKPVESRPNCYTLETASIVEGFPSIVVPAAGTIVEFTTPDPTDLPLPDSRYLALHAACAQVSHASGAAEYIDELLCDMEDRTVLASDGSSSKLLDHALSLVNAFV